MVPVPAKHSTGANFSAPVLVVDRPGRFSHARNTPRERERERAREGGRKGKGKVERKRKAGRDEEK